MLHLQVIFTASRRSTQEYMRVDGPGWAGGGRWQGGDASIMDHTMCIGLLLRQLLGVCTPRGAAGSRGAHHRSACMATGGWPCHSPASFRLRSTCSPGFSEDFSTERTFSQQDLRHIHWDIHTPRTYVFRGANSAAAMFKAMSHRSDDVRRKEFGTGAFPVDQIM